MSYTYYSLYDRVWKKFLVENASIKEIADFLGISAQTVYNSRRNGTVIKDRFEVMIYEPELVEEKPKKKEKDIKAYRVSSSSLYYPG